VHFFCLCCINISQCTVQESTTSLCVTNIMLCFHCYAMDQVNHWPLTVENRVRSQACQCESKGGQNNTATDSSQRASVSPVSIIPLRFFRKANARVRITCKDGARPALFPNLLCCSVLCLCVSVYCTTATGCQTQLQLTNISISIYINVGRVAQSV